MIPIIASADAAPKVFGVTQGSVYKEYVKPIWYESNAWATLSLNSGPHDPFTNGTKISATGEYELIVYTPGDQTIVNFEIDTSVSAAVINTNINKDGTILEIDFQSGAYVATPVFAIWTEDIFGNFIQNLYVSAVPATNIMRFTNNEVKRPQAVPFWAHKNCIEKEYNGDFLFLAEPAIPIPEDLDGVTGATQKTGFIVNTKAHTNIINDSRIKIFFEMNQSFDDGWYFYGANDAHEEDNNGSFSNDNYFSGSEEPAIVYSAELDLKISQTIIIGGNDGQTEVTPVGYSHYGGRTSALYTDFYADDNGTQRYKFDHAHLMVALLTATVTPGSTNYYLGDFDRDEDVDGLDLMELVNHPDLIENYLANFAMNFGKTDS
ncbi:MAG: hypothetical protein GY729_17865 [Desulfobacteraceae bacterium]|nr:hypothetical protein [Desulfobacteraceae bacterium]